MKRQVKENINHQGLTPLKYIIYVFMTAVMAVFLSGCHRHENRRAMDDSRADRDSFLLLATSDTVSTEMSIEVQQGVILERVKDIYSMIRSDYMSHGGSFENELYDLAFCSKSWNRLMMRVHKKEFDTGTLFYEINHWSMAQSSGIMPFFDEFEIRYINMRSRVKRAVVSFTVYEDYTYTPARVELVYEDNQWKIDNFYNMKYRLNVRTAMWNYIHRPYLI